MKTRSDGPDSVKICGLSTPETLRAALDAGRRHGRVRATSRESPRHVDPRDRRMPSRRAARGGRSAVALLVDSATTRIARRHCRGARSRPPAAARLGDARARRGHPGPLRPAGHEGASAIADGGDLAGDRALMRRSPTACSSTPSRRRGARCPAATVCPSTGGSSPDLTPASPFMLSGASTPTTWPRRSRCTGARARRRFVGRRGRAGRKGSGADRGLHQGRAGGLRAPLEPRRATA